MQRFPLPSQIPHHQPFSRLKEATLLSFRESACSILLPCFPYRNPPTPSRGTPFIALLPKNIFTAPEIPSIFPTESLLIPFNTLTQSLQGTVLPFSQITLLILIRKNSSFLFQQIPFYSLENTFPNPPRNPFIILSTSVFVFRQSLSFFLLTHHYSHCSLLIHYKNFFATS